MAIPKDEQALLRAIRRNPDRTKNENDLLKIIKRLELDVRYWKTRARKK